MSEYPHKLPPPSIAIAIDEAWSVMRRILFEPFDIGKWFVLGFSAWLAALGESGGGGGGPGGNYAPSDGSGGPDMNGVTNFFQEHLAIILTVVAVVVIILVTIGVVVLWVQSRGKFMFLDNVAMNRAEIARPWKAFRSAGNSLFLWSLVFGFLSFLVFALIVGLGLMLAWPSIAAGAFGPNAVTALIVSIPLFLMYLLVASIIVVFLHDFVVPIMYTQQIGAVAGWGAFLGLFKPRFWTFVLYLLVRFGLGIVAGVAILALVVCTCCIAGCIMAIPYIGTVLLLPVIVFFRALSITFLRQFGPDFDVFPHPPTVPELPGFGEGI